MEIWQRIEELKDKNELEDEDYMLKGVMLCAASSFSAEKSEKMKGTSRQTSWARSNKGMFKTTLKESR